MKKSRILAMITEILYLVPVVLAVIFMKSLKAATETAQASTDLGESIGMALTTAISLLLYVIVLLYLVIAAMPLLGKTVQIIAPRMFLSNLCIVFDCITFVIHAALTVFAVLKGSGTTAIAIFGGFTAISIAAFVLNIITKKVIDDEEMDDFFDDIYDNAMSRD